MSQSESNDKTAALTELFVKVTGDEQVTEPQEADDGDREVRQNHQIPEAVADGLEDAIDGAESISNAPGG